MPTVRPISELQRNIASITQEWQVTKEPIYLTNNGSAALVIMDADAFDRKMSVHRDVLEREDRVFRAIMCGREDELASRTRSFEQAREDARRLRANHD